MRILRPIELIRSPFSGEFGDAVAQDVWVLRDEGTGSRWRIEVPLLVSTGDTTRFSSLAHPSTSEGVVFIYACGASSPGSVRRALSTLPVSRRISKSDAWMSVKKLKPFH
jgi:hypothetical protein